MPGGWGSGPSGEEGAAGMAGLWNVPGGWGSGQGEYARVRPADGAGFKEENVAQEV